MKRYDLYHYAIEMPQFARHRIYGACMSSLPDIHRWAIDDGHQVVESCCWRPAFAIKAHLPLTPSWPLDPQFFQGLPIPAPKPPLPAGRVTGVEQNELDDITLITEDGELLLRSMPHWIEDGYRPDWYPAWYAFVVYRRVDAEGDSAFVEVSGGCP